MVNRYLKIMLWTLDEVVADNIFIFGNDPRFVKDNLKEEVTGSDLDDTDDYYDTSDDSDDEESVANIDDGLLDAVFDELPGKMQQKNIEKIMKTKQSVHIKTFILIKYFFRNWSNTTSSPNKTKTRCSNFT